MSTLLSHAASWLLLASVALFVGCGPPPTQRLKQLCHPDAPPAAAGDPFSQSSADMMPQPLPNAYGYLQGGPVFAGAEIPGPPQPTATERALALRQELDQLAATKRQMQDDLTNVNVQLAERQQTLIKATQELQTTQQQLDTVRGDVQNWRRDVEELHTRMRSSERKQLDALEDVVQLLGRTIDGHRADSPADEDSQALRPLSPPGETQPARKAIPKPPQKDDVPDTLAPAEPDASLRWK